MKSFSPLRYPGGKGCVSNYVKALIEANCLGGCTYVEPYCGGAGVAIELLRLEFAWRIMINDADPAIHAFWKSVVSETEELCRRISAARISVSNWRRQRAVLDAPEEHDHIDLGFAAFFLNRANRSGILKAGPIGGFAQSGDWGIDARFNKKVLIKCIEGIGALADRITVSGQDALVLLRSIAPKLPRSSLVYLDPPYVVKGKRLYRNSYDLDDHALVCAAAKSLKSVHWMVSYDNVAEIRELYASHRTITYDLKYSANTSCVGSEIMIFSPKLKLPNVETPANLTEREWRATIAA